MTFSYPPFLWRSLRNASFIDAMCCYKDSHYSKWQIAK